MSNSQQGKIHQIGASRLKKEASLCIMVIMIIISNYVCLKTDETGVGP
jgi:hypothetical protein